MGDRGKEMKITHGKKVKPPRGYLKMLARHPAYAMKDWRRQKEIHRFGGFTYGHNISSVFLGEKARFTYKTESVDKWHLQFGSERYVGDCEEFALSCRHKLSLINFSSRLILCQARVSDRKSVV